MHSPSLLESAYEFYFRLKVDTEAFLDACVGLVHEAADVGGGGPAQVHHEVGVLGGELRPSILLPFHADLLDEVTRRAAWGVLESGACALALWLFGLALFEVEAHLRI